MPAWPRVSRVALGVHEEGERAFLAFVEDGCSWVVVAWLLRINERLLAAFVRALLRHCGPLCRCAMRRFVEGGVGAKSVLGSEIRRGESESKSESRSESGSESESESERGGSGGGGEITI